MNIDEFIDRFGDDLQYASSYVDSETYRLIDPDSEIDKTNENVLEVGFLQSSPPPYWIEEPDTNDEESQSSNPSVDQELLDIRKLEMIENLEKKREKWIYETGHRYLAILNSKNTATVFKVIRITEKAVLIDTDTWIPFSACKIAEGFPPFSQSGNLDFVIELPKWFREKEAQLDSEIIKGSISGLDFKLDLNVFSDFHEGLVDIHMCETGQISGNDSETKAIRQGILGYKSLLANSYYGRVSIIHSLTKRGLNLFTEF